MQVDFIQAAQKRLPRSFGQYSIALPDQCSMTKDVTSEGQQLLSMSGGSRL